MTMTDYVLPSYGDVEVVPASEHLSRIYGWNPEHTSRFELAETTPDDADHIAEALRRH